MAQHTNFQTPSNHSNPLPASSGPHNYNYNSTNHFSGEDLHLKIQYLENANNRLLDLLHIVVEANAKTHKEFLQQNHNMLKIIQSYSQDILQFRAKFIGLLSVFSNQDATLNQPTSNILGELEINMQALNNITKHIGTITLQQITNEFNKNALITHNFNIVKSQLHTTIQLVAHYKQKASKIPLLNEQINKQHEIIAKYEKQFGCYREEESNYSADFINPLNSNNSVQESDDFLLSAVDTSNSNDSLFPYISNYMGQSSIDLTNDEET